jgi:peptidoglycan/LPS O-acetylase OafA/YrhL
MRRLGIVEFLKGYSIFTIIIFHYLQTLHLPGPWNQFIFFGGTGVHLFILLSGFGLYLSYLRKPLPYSLYLKKRLSKIYIPYIIVVLLSALISLWKPIYENSLYALGGHIFLYKMFDESIMGSYGYPLWFISTILQFYIVFYALIFTIRRTSMRAFLFVCFILSIGWISVVMFIGKDSERIWNSFFLRYLWEFGLGMFIADQLFKSDFRLPFKVKPTYFLLIGVINCALYAVLALYGGAIGKMTNDIPALLGYSCIAIWFFLMNIGFINKFFIYSGKISFSLYLLHYLLLYLCLFIVPVFPAPVVLPIALLLTFVVSKYYQNAVSVLYQKLEV